MVFRNADLNSFKPDINIFNKSPTNFQLIKSALKDDPLFAEIVRECEWNEDYIIDKGLWEQNHKVSWGDKSGGKGLLDIQETEEGMTLGRK